MTDICALREAAERAKAARTYFIRKQSRDAEIAYDKADEDFRDEANPAAIIDLLDRLKEAEEAVATERKKALEEAAKVAEDRADAYAQIANEHEGTPIGESNTMRCGAAAAIADAIRKLGEG